MDTAGLSCCQDGNTQTIGSIAIAKRYHTASCAYRSADRTARELARPSKIYRPSIAILTHSASGDEVWKEFMCRALRLTMRSSGILHL